MQPDPKQNTKLTKLSNDFKWNRKSEAIKKFIHFADQFGKRKIESSFPIDLIMPKTVFIEKMRPGVIHK